MSMADAQSPLEEELRKLFSRLIKQAFDQNPLQESGVSPPQLALLDWIATSPGASVQETAQALDLTPPTVSVSVRRLEDAGLLQRRADPADGRAIQIYLTDRGESLHHRALVFRRARMAELLAGLTDREAQTLVDLLAKAIDAAEEHQDTPTQEQSL
jgi:DNA-binding MarR family transcriptional regulator